MSTDSFVNARYASAPGSPIRELKRFSELPGMISLAGGYPAPELMDAAGLQQMFARFAPSELGQALEYGGTEARWRCAWSSHACRAHAAWLPSLRTC